MAVCRFFPSLHSTKSFLPEPFYGAALSLQPPYSSLSPLHHLLLLLWPLHSAEEGSTGCGVGEHVLVISITKKKPRLPVSLFIIEMLSSRKHHHKQFPPGNETIEKPQSSAPGHDGLCLVKRRVWLEGGHWNGEWDRHNLWCRRKLGGLEKVCEREDLQL